MRFLVLLFIGLLQNTINGSLEIALLEVAGIIRCAVLIKVALRFLFAGTCLSAAAPNGDRVNTKQ